MCVCVCVCVYVHTHTRACITTATASKSCNKKSGKDGKSCTPTIPPGPGVVEAGRRKQGTKGEAAMLLRFNKQPIKHLTTAGEQWWRDRAGERKEKGHQTYRERGGQNEG